MVLFAPLIAVAALVVVALVLRAGQARQRRALLGNAVEAPVAGPAILYFTGAACSICHTAQRPALQRLAPAIAGHVTLHEIDVAAEPEMAQRFKVMSLPTTVVIDREGRARAVNSGFASAAQLRRQLVEAEVLPA